jgi:hypothetical protein
LQTASFLNSVADLDHRSVIWNRFKREKRESPVMTLKFLHNWAQK